jgi:ferritin-like metal-binding protein YciE
VPASVSNPRDLYLTVLSDMLFVERMLSFEVLPGLLEKANDPSLTGALAEHLEQTKAHVKRVEAAFGAVGAETSSSSSPPFVGLTEQHEQLTQAAVEPALGDVIHAHAALHTEHYEIAGYRLLIALADACAPQALVGLRENLADEEHALGRLQELTPGLLVAAGAQAPALG